jgi:FMN reductase
VTVRLFDGDHLSRLPLFNPKSHGRSVEERELLDAVRSCDGMILASPGYHGSVSGVVKNALDLLEDTARDERPYLHDLPVGIIVTAYGWQATGSTIAALRSIVHALRGWPTPFAAAINSLETRIDADGPPDITAIDQLGRVAEQVVRASSVMSWKRPTS